MGCPAAVSRTTALLSISGNAGCWLSPESVSMTGRTIRFESGTPHPAGGGAGLSFDDPAYDRLAPRRRRLDR